MILMLLDSVSKLECLEVSKDWDRRLSSELTLWREFKTNICYASDLQVVCDLSADTLSSVDTGFSNQTEESDLEACFKCFRRSAKTLESIHLGGELKKDTGLDKALDLASNCVNLEYFDYEVYEDAEYEEPYSSSHVDEYERDRVEAIEKRHRILKLNDYNFKTPPSTIKILVSRLFTLD